MAFRNAAAAIGTTATTVYTCPANYECVFHSLYISNLDSVNTISVDVTVQYSKVPSLGTKYAIKNAAIPAGTSLIFDKPITLRPGDTLKAKSSVANSCEIIGSMLLTLEDSTAPN